MTEDEMLGWHHQLNGHGFGWTLVFGDGQGGLACCSSWGRKESDTAKQLNCTGGLVVKNPSANAGDAGDGSPILGSGRSPGEENSNPLQ